MSAESPACPNCGYMTPDARRKAHALERARDQVELLTLDADRLAWCAEAAPGFDPVKELELFKIQFRRSEYKLSAGKGGFVRNGWAAFQYHMWQAVKFENKGRAEVKPPLVGAGPPQKVTREDVEQVERDLHFGWTRKDVPPKVAAMWTKEIRERHVRDGFIDADAPTLSEFAGKRRASRAKV